MVQALGVVWCYNAASTVALREEGGSSGFWPPASRARPGLRATFPGPVPAFRPFTASELPLSSGSLSIRLPFQWLCFNALSQVDCQTFSVERINSNPQNQPTAIVWIRNFSLDQQSHNQISCHYCGCLSSSMFLTKITILEWSNVTFSSWDAVSRFATRPSSLLSCFTFGKRSAQGDLFGSTWSSRGGGYFVR